MARQGDCPNHLVGTAPFVNAKGAVPIYDQRNGIHRTTWPDSAYR
jgi:hypothetical protein